MSQAYPNLPLKRELRSNQALCKDMVAMSLTEFYVGPKASATPPPVPEFLRGATVLGQARAYAPIGRRCAAQGPVKRSFPSCPVVPVFPFVLGRVPLLR